MQRKVLAARAAAVAAFFLLGTSARAAVDTFSLTGNLAGFQYTPAVNGEVGSIPLSGLGPAVVSPGDTLSIGLSLDGLLVVPAGSSFSYVGIDFAGTGFDGSPVSVTEAFTFYVLGVETAASSGRTDTNGQVSTYADFFNQTIAFDTLADTAVVQALAAPVTLTSAYLEVGSFNAVPEPAIWVLMIVGLGAVGSAMRRAKRTPGFRLGKA